MECEAHLCGQERNNDSKTISPPEALSYSIVVYRLFLSHTASSLIDYRLSAIGYRLSAIYFGMGLSRHLVCAARHIASRNLL